LAPPTSIKKLANELILIVRIELFATSYILREYDVLARHRVGDDTENR